MKVELNLERPNGNGCVSKMVSMSFQPTVGMNIIIGRHTEEYRGSMQEDIWGTVGSVVGDVRRNRLIVRVDLEDDEDEFDEKFFRDNGWNFDGENQE
ncbi:MAG: hypothetical protein G01um101470_139 [Parcubacteria group bacterium Gr01-1014_70]|nr:MAG: hypothetical protein G01um101470_139 [Parcubacteria group bacterium Gr01-1014_70]